MDVSQEDKFVSAVGSVSWATGTQSNAVEFDEATLHLLSYKINQDLVLRTAFHSLPQLSSTQPPSAPESICSLLGKPIASTPRSLPPLSLLQSPLAPAPHFQAGSLAAQVTPGSFFGQISNLKTLEVTDCSILVMTFRGQKQTWPCSQQGARATLSPGFTVPSWAVPKG